jgi:outer membrane immunogenic protein
MSILDSRAIAIIGLCLAAPMANAADLRFGDVAAPPPVFSWTGYYVGAFVGGAHGLWTVDFYRNNNHGHAEEGADGGAFGVWGGYNYQFANRLVVGGEVDFGKTNAKQSNDIFDNDTSLAEFGVFGSARARFGYAFDRVLLFGTTGVSFASITNNIQKGRNAGEQVVWEDQVRAGPVVGAGVEYAFTNNLIGRGEYLYSNYGTVTLFNRDGNRADFKNELHLLRAGLSYKF